MTGDARTEAVHELRCWPPYFAAVLDGSKTFELRVDDRPFTVGDLLRLREFQPGPETYTGRETTRRISYVLRGVFGVQRGFVVLALAAPPPAVKRDAPSDVGYTLWALADDWRAEQEDGALLDPDDTYDWLVAQGRKLGAR